jgi:serine/threonine-protein kinase haspin
VDVGLVALDEDTTVTKERVVPKIGARVDLVAASLRPQPKDDKKSTAVREPRNTYRAEPAIIDIASDSEPELPPPRQKRATARRRQIVVSSDEDEYEAQYVARTPISPFPSTSSPYLPPPPLSPPSPALNSPCERPLPERTKQRCSSPRPPQYDTITNKPRQLTPIRRGKKPFPQSPGSVISLEDDESDLDDTDVDDLLKFADLSCSDYHDHAREVPDFLLPLLQECNQDSPHEFSSFINSFPFDHIVQSYESELAAYSKAEFRKVGEASYSEVFGIGSVVLKIVPLRDEYETKPAVYRVESPPTSYARDIIQEIAATRLMGELCEGIVKLLRTYVVRGKYPSLLLSLWDKYDYVNGSESIKPGEENGR